jgi:hypothetical protein
MCDMCRAPLPPHGTRARYEHRRHPCHEACCRRAHAEWTREYRLRVKLRYQPELWARR